MYQNELVTYIGITIDELSRLCREHAENNIDHDLTDIATALDGVAHRLAARGYLSCRQSDAIEIEEASQSKDDIIVVESEKRTVSEPPLNRGGRHYGEVVNYNLEVPNQFHAQPSVRQACVPISICVIYHIYTTMIVERDSLKHEDWIEILGRAAKLWHLWKKRQIYSCFLNETSRNFPTVKEILSLPECSGFTCLFGDTPVECGGLVQNDDSVDNSEGSLAQFMENLVATSRNSRKNVCALLILPNYICLSVVAVRENVSLRPSVQMIPAHILLFDSHGGASDNRSRYCEFIRFSDHRDVLRHLMRKYDLGASSLRAMSQQERALYKEEELVALFSYSAMMFVK
jgi:hypothetical protein